MIRFIVDAQLPKKLCTLLSRLGADCIHTLDLPEKNRTNDKTIIQLSVAENRIILTKDNDFLQSYLLLNEPKNYYL